jgi:hypothetical protein
LAQSSRTQQRFHRKFFNIIVAKINVVDGFVSILPGAIKTLRLGPGTNHIPTLVEKIHRFRPHAFIRGESFRRSLRDRRDESRNRGDFRQRG